MDHRCRSISMQDKSTSFDALEDWLVSPVINTLQDPIAYLSGMQAASHPLATMALDFLSIPDESSHASTILSSWSGLEGAIPKDIILQLFKDKSKQPKKKQK
ncbi:hypothetical protein BYT27DRAFT_7217523, partial [Phlegmacium glaucopus]